MVALEPLRHKTTTRHPQTARKETVPLNARRTAICKRSHLVQRRHRRVARERRQQRAMRPSQLDRLFRRIAVQQPMNRPGSKTIAAANAVGTLSSSRRRKHRFAIHPRHRTPAMMVRVVHLAQRRRNNLRLREPRKATCSIMPRNALVSQLRARRLRARRNLRPSESKPLLQVLFVADQHVDILDNLSQLTSCARFRTALRLPELLAVVQVERRHHACSFAPPFIASITSAESRLRQRRKNAARVEPAHTAPRRSPSSQSRRASACAAASLQRL